jgi:hypothetical protein
MSRLIESMNQENLRFTVYDGDTKDGSSECADKTIGEEVATLFNKVKAPTVYVLGDNEWTDCHRSSNGGYSNLERLDYIRKTLFADNRSFGQKKMPLERQGEPGGLYSENTRWTQGGIIFVGLNIPGSNNNKISEGKCLSAKSVRTQVDCDADNAEYLARDKANIDFLHQSFDIAKKNEAAGLMLFIQADMGFDLPETDTVIERDLPIYSGYNNFIAALMAETTAFSGQVVLVHGDTHFYKVDKPLVDQMHIIKNFTRVETFGSPNVHWVKVNVDLKNPNVFTFQPVMVPGN